MRFGLIDPKHFYQLWKIELTGSAYITSVIPDVGGERGSERKEPRWSPRRAAHAFGGLGDAYPVSVLETKKMNLLLEIY
jgi:hypothetical protein